MESWKFNTGTQRIKKMLAKETTRTYSPQRIFANWLSIVQGATVTIHCVNECILE